MKALDELEAIRFTFGRAAAKTKLALLEAIGEDDASSADEIVRLHDVLCFIRAYADDRPVLRRAEQMLAGFADRTDLDRHRAELVNSGIAGTEIRFPFYWFTARRLARRWGEKVTIDWPAFGARRKSLLDRRLPFLMPYSETLALEEAAMTTRQWIDYLKGPAETDAYFVVRRFEALRAESMPRESIFEEIDIPFRLKPGPDTPCTTRSRYSPSPVVFQRKPLVRTRETFHRELRRPPRNARYMPPAEARELIDMARTLMVVRERDLDVFVHADESDVQLLDYPEGIQFACFGTDPERRQLLDAAYGFLMLRNGVPVGYVLSASLFNSAEVAYNVSPAFRGAEAAHLYGRVLSGLRHLFQADAFVVDPYQMGHENPEGLRSGAWWFYYKLGFRPLDPTIAGLAEAEQRRVREQRGYRSSLARLNRLSSVNMYLHLSEPRSDVVGELSRENIGLHIVRYLADRFGAERERGITKCSREATRLLGTGPSRSWRPGQRQAWERWSPLVMMFEGVEDWPARDRRALAAVIRAKGGRRESEFVKRFDAHARLRDAIFALSRQSPE